MEGEVIYSELVLDFKLMVGRALPVQPEHNLRMIVLLLTCVLRQAVRALQAHMIVGNILQG